MGSWQLGRFEDRVDNHRQAEAQVADAKKEQARPLDDLLPVTKATSGKQATATGRYDTQLLVPGRTLDDKDGYYVLTLLRTDTGRALPVVRGWLPGEPDPAKAPAPPARRGHRHRSAPGLRDPGQQWRQRPERAAGGPDRRDQRRVPHQPRPVRRLRRLGHAEPR